MSWSEVAEEVSVYWVPGDHYTVITKHAQALTEKLRTCLERAQKSEPRTNED